tara:strand:+ start:269 stop:454 length:186 start_codon:yes stop_codon:yes gene_type:complete
MNVPDRITKLLTYNPKASRYLDATRMILEEELYQLSIVGSEYERDYILSAIFKNINILEGK